VSVEFITTFAAEEATGLASLGINFKALLLQAGTFLILYLLFKKFAMAKVVNTLAERRDKIDEGLANAELMEKRMAELEVKTEEQLKQARAQADEVIAKAHEDSGHLIAQAEEAAAKRAEGMIEDARKTMSADLAKVKKDLRGEMLDLIATATETVLGEKIDSKKDTELIERALAGVKK
jgi:F-type H+-transporting ATPase subunit b